MTTSYPPEVLGPDDDDGTIVDNVTALADAVVGHRIVSVERGPGRRPYYDDDDDEMITEDAAIITLDNGKRVQLFDTDDCCAGTELDAFLLHPELVDHIITGVGTTGKYSTWHIYADMGDVLELTVNWGPGNPFYYAYGFRIVVVDA